MIHYHKILSTPILINNPDAKMDPGTRIVIKYRSMLRSSNEILKPVGTIFPDTIKTHHKTASSPLNKEHIRLSRPGCKTQPQHTAALYHFQKALFRS